MKASVKPTDIEPTTDRVIIVREPFEDLWDTKRLAQFLGFTYDKTVRMVHELGLPYSQWGGKTSPMRFRPEEIHDWVIAHELKPVRPGQ